MTYSVIIDNLIELFFVLQFKKKKKNSHFYPLYAQIYWQSNITCDNQIKLLQFRNFETCVEKMWNSVYMYLCTIMHAFTYIFKPPSLPPSNLFTYYGTFVSIVTVKISKIVSDVYEHLRNS